MHTADKLVFNILPSAPPPPPSPSQKTTHNNNDNEWSKPLKQKLIPCVTFYLFWICSKSKIWMNKEKKEQKKEEKKEKRKKDGWQMKQQQKSPKLVCFKSCPPTPTPKPTQFSELDIYFSNASLRQIT